MILVAVYLAGAVIMAAHLFCATDAGRALVGTPGEAAGAYLLWVVAWPVMAVLLLAAWLLTRCSGIRFGWGPE